MTHQATATPLTSEGPQPKPAQGIGREMAKGTGWVIAARLAVQGIGILSTLILARLLTPADFGLVALATAVSAALLAISEFSFDVVLIQNQNAGRAHYDTAWTLSILRNAILALCLVVSSETTAEMLGDPRLRPIIYWIALSLLVDGFQNIGIVDFRKDLAFHKDLIFTVIGKLGGFVITVPLAFLWRDYWALVAGMVGGTFLRMALSFIMHNYRPRFSLARWREIMHTSKWLVLNNVCGFLFTRSDTFVIGKIIGAQAVGVYSIAYEVANLVTSNLIAPIRRVILPGYAKVSEDGDNLRRTFVQVFELVMLIGTPMAIGIGAVSAPLVHLMLGAQWLDSIPLIQVLSLYGFSWLINTGTGPVLLALGRPHYITWLLAGTSLILIPTLIIGCMHAGTLGAAWAVTGSSAVGVVADFIIIVRLLRLRAVDLLNTAWRPIVAAALMLVVVRGLELAWGGPVDVAGWLSLLVAEVVLGAVVYIISALILWLVGGRPDGAEGNLIREARYWVRRLAR